MDIGEKIREYLAAHAGSAALQDVDQAGKAESVEPVSSTDTAKTSGMANGGEVIDPKNGIRTPATGLPGVPALPGFAPTEDEKLKTTMDHLIANPQPVKSEEQKEMDGDTGPNLAHGGVATPNNNTPHKAPEGPSDDEKRELVMKTLKEKPVKMADGGMPDDSVDESQLPLPVDAPQESKLQAILKTLGMAGNNFMASPAGTALKTVVNPVDAIANAAGNKMVSEAPQLVNPALKAAGALTGQTLPQIPSSVPAMPPVQAMPPVPQAAAPTASVAAPQAAPAAPSAPAADPLSQLGKFDASAATQGFNPADRQALANNLQTNQHSFGNYLSEALAGLGDAVAAKGGVQQDSLGKIFALQTQQRQEALENFDKARQASVDHFTMKNQADQALIANLKAKGELQVAPGIAKAVGHPELAGKPVQQAELVIKADGMKYEFANHMQERKIGALKDAADEVDKAVAHGGLFGTQKMMDPQTRLKFIHQQAIKSDPEAFGYTITGEK